MGTDLSEWVAHPLGEQPEVEEWSRVADTFAGRVHIEWDTATPVTPLGQLPFFIEYLKQGGLFDGWVADCPLLFTVACTRSWNAASLQGGTAPTPVREKRPKGACVQPTVPSLVPMDAQTAAKMRGSPPKALECS